MTWSSPSMRSRSTAGHGRPTFPASGCWPRTSRKPHVLISTVADGTVVPLPGVEISARPMIGTIGVAPSAPGQTSLLVPTEAGGNMDIRQLGIGARLHLPIRVAGALVSAGDAHAVQGDGEICGTGAEINATLRIRVHVDKAAGSSAPWYEHSARPASEHWMATTGIGPDHFLAARNAARRGVDLLARGGLDPIDAYLLLSLVGELRVSEIVDAPNWSSVCISQRSTHTSDLTDRISLRAR
jgi:acetamidase/formamidase